MKTIVYLTINNKNRKIYIGIHETENPDKFDGYLGNGVNIYKPSSILHPKTPFQSAVKKYGFDAFSRVTLFICNTREEAENIERFLVNENFVGRSDTYNITLGGDTPPLLNKIIYQYSLSGNYLRSFNSIKEASDYIHICETAISHAVLYGHMSGEFYWSDIKVDKLDLSNKPILQKKSTYLYTSKGVFFMEFKSMSDTARYLDVNLSSIQKAVKLGTKISKYYISDRKFDVYPIKSQERKRSNDPIYQYDLEGNFLRSFKNSKEAKEFCNLKQNRLSNAINLNQSCGEYFWSWEKVDKLEIPKNFNPCKKRKVGRYDFEGNLLETFDTVRECKKQYANVSKVLKGTASHCKGFVFKYIE